MDRLQNDRPDREFLERCFHKLLINFAGGSTRLTPKGTTSLKEGSLGLDNITTFDRSIPPGDGKSLKQADATVGWGCTQA